MYSFSQDNTIVAISTPQGSGAIAVIRLSGSSTFEILSKCFTNHKIVAATPNTVLYGYLKDKESIIDEVLIAIFRAPHSYTKEDVAEISCHGSRFIQRKILEVLLGHGAVLAEPGEFTRRAFLNGRFNLLQAEAVADLIASESAAQHQLALHQMKGGFSSQLSEMREELINLTALLELELDFGEEDVEFANRQQLSRSSHNIRLQLQQLAQSFKNGNAIKKGIPIAIAGPPNVGKSTLLNHLLQEDKAIVSDIPGTTRDVIEDSLVIDGVLFRLIDTAGIRTTSDIIEEMGIERSRKTIAQAELVMLLYDRETPLQYLLDILDFINKSGKRHLYVHNKIDMQSEQSVPRFDGEIQISAKTGQGIDLLRKALLDNCGVATSNYDSTVSNIRHYDALVKADAALDKVEKGMRTGLSSELVAEDLREALYHIGSITGEVVADEVLGAIFSRFCIGK